MRTNRKRGLNIDGYTPIVRARHRTRRVPGGGSMEEVAIYGSKKLRNRSGRETSEFRRSDDTDQGKSMHRCAPTRLTTTSLVTDRWVGLAPATSVNESALG
ncbi:hypothetical protein PTI98_006577 [Pleurotus ostreatus]|nr:hypothetical protein PTI98_006577 [Pleurotus ostreatus]